MFTFKIVGIKNLINNYRHFLEIVLNIGKVSLWLQTIGILSLFIIVSIIVNFILNKKEIKQIIFA